MRLLSFPVVDQCMSQGLEVAKAIQVEPFKFLVWTAFLIGHLCISWSPEVIAPSLRRDYGQQRLGSVDVVHERHLPSLAAGLPLLTVFQSQQRFRCSLLA
jgi:hypothetical protein